MSEPTTHPRPRQVTMAGGFAVGGSLLMLLTLFDTMASLHTLGVQQGIADFLSKPPGDGLGLTVARAQELIRVLVLVAAAVAAAALVLGVFVLRGNAQARLGLTVLALPLVLTAPVSGLLLGLMVAAATALLWSQPARDWFAGPDLGTTSPGVGEQWPRMPSGPTPGGPDQPDQPPRADRPSPNAWAPPSGRPWGSATVSGQITAAPPSRESAGSGRPATVVWAVVLSVAGALVTGGLLTAGFLLVVADPSLVTDRLENDPELSRVASSDALVATILVLLAVLVGWCLAVLVIATSVWSGRSWARVALTASAAITLLGGVLAFPAGLLWSALAGAVLLLLWLPASAGWFGPRGAAPASVAPTRRREPW